MKQKRNALIVIDMQKDFCPGWALAVNDGDRVIHVINAVAGRFFKVIATRDWHAQNHISFATNNPHILRVSLSDRLKNLKTEMIRNIRKEYF